MRILIGSFLLLNGLLTTAILLGGALSPKTVPAERLSDKNSKGKKTAAGPRYGVKTPGVLISMENLKAEAELPEPFKPEWLLFSESLYVPAKDSIEKINAKTNKPGDPVSGVAQPCAGMVSAFGSFWTASCAESALVRIDPKTLKITKKLSVGVASGGMAATSDSVWFFGDTKPTLTRVDPDENAVVGELRLPLECRSLVFGETSLWVACPEDGKVLRINPSTNLVDKTIDVPGLPQTIAVGEGSIWVFCKKEGKLNRIDPKTNKVSKTIDLEVPGVDGYVAVGEGYVWVSQQGYPLARISPVVDKEKVLQQFYGEGGGPILTSAGALWISDLSAGKLIRIDPKRVLATLAE